MAPGEAVVRLCARAAFAAAPASPSGSAGLAKGAPSASAATAGARPAEEGTFAPLRGGAAERCEELRGAGSVEVCGEALCRGAFDRLRGERGHVPPRGQCGTLRAGVNHFRSRGKIWDNYQRVEEGESVCLQRRSEQKKKN